jgi:sodium transport system permease protein
VKRETVALGKMISLAIVAMGSTLSSLTGILVTLPLSSSLFGGIDMANISVSLEQWLFLGAALVLLAGVYVTLILSLSMIAGSVKEAGAYVTPVYMVVLVSGMMAATGFGGDHLRNYLIPVFGNVLVLRDIFVDEVTWSGFLTNSGISLLVILILLLAFRRIFKMERYLYGG